ncbi:MAG: peptidylprolyl isomerase [Bacteroidales bacterium]
MRKLTHMLTLLLLLAHPLRAQEPEVLLRIAGEEVTLDEFERIYRKNNNENSLNRQSPEEYLELYIHFKLKVLEATALGMDTTRKFRNELDGYLAQLAKPYLSDPITKEEMMREAYERSREDVRASHILLRLPADPTPDDTLEAYQRILAIRQRILEGESFEAVARATSDDASVSRNGGDLGYFTVFSMIYPFETVAYESEPGSVSLPFRSNYGYHILRVTDRRPARGQVKVAHIFFRNPETMTEQEKAATLLEVRAVYDSLRTGTDFGELAGRHSDDPSSARAGGEMTWFGTGRMIPEFEDASFGLQQAGQITEPFASAYGWHIVKLLDKKGIGSFEEMKPELQEKINRADRSEVRNERFLAKLRKEHPVEFDPLALSEFESAVDSTLLLGKWDAGNLKNSERVLMRIQDQSFSAGEFARYVEAKQSRQINLGISACLRNLLKEFADGKLLEVEEALLPEKYPEFRDISREYHDGILLFDIMDRMVWSKAATDTMGLESFFRDHRRDYLWGERLEILDVRFTDPSLEPGLMALNKKLRKGKLGQAQLREKLCPGDSIPCVELARLVEEKGKDPGLDRLKEGEAGSVTEGPGNGMWHYPLLLRTRNPEPKDLDETRGQVISDYQDHLESVWVRELEAKYPVEVHRDLLKNLRP